MRIKILSVAFVIVVIIGLIGCRGFFEPEFPITITRISDGIQISFGMDRENIENILVPMSEDNKSILESWEIRDDIMGLYGDVDNFIRVIYNEYDIAWIFNIRCSDWTFAGISLGGDIQRIIDSERFEHIYHSGMENYSNIFGPISGIVEIFFECDENRAKLSLLYDEYGKIYGINLFDLNY